MPRLTMLLATAALLAAPLLAQEAPPAPTPPKPAFDTVRVTMQTSAGAIVLELERQRAPLTTAYFLKYVDGRRLDGTNIYRATKVGAGYGLIQGGTRNDPKRTLPPVAHEPTTRTGLTHVDGAISLARAAPGTAAGDFFIAVGNLPSLDADPKAAGDNQGFATFGHVVQGMEVVRAILDGPVSPTAGSGAMKGQMLVAPVRIVSVRRSD